MTLWDDLGFGAKEEAEETKNKTLWDDLGFGSREAQKPDEQYELPEQPSGGELGLVQGASQAFGRTAEGFLQNVLGGYEWVLRARGRSYAAAGRDDLATIYDEKANWLADQHEKSVGMTQERYPGSESVSQGKAFQPGNWRWWTEGGTGVATQLLTMVGGGAATRALGGTAKAAQGVAMGTIVGPAAGGKAKDLYEQLKQEEDMSEEERLLLSGIGGSAMGLAEVVLAKLPVGEFLSKNPQARSKVLTFLADKVAKNPKLAEFAASKGGRLAGGGLAEASEEVPAELLDATLDFVIAQDPEAFKDIQGRLAAAGTLGALGGVGLKGAEVGGETFIEQMPQFKDARKSAATADADRILKENPDALRKLAGVEKPTRADFEEAGFDMNQLRLNRKDRKEFAESLGRFFEDADPQDQVIIDQEQADVDQGTVVEPGPQRTPEVQGPQEQPAQQPIAGMPEQRRLEERIREVVPEGEQELVEPTAQLLQSTFASEQEWQQIEQEKGGEAAKDALYQVAQTARRMAEDPDIKTTNNEAAFFKSWGDNIKKTRKELGLPNVNPFKGDAKKSMTEYASQVKKWKKGELKSRPKVPNLGVGSEFDKNVSPAAIKKLAKQALDTGSRQFMEDRKFTDYYQEDVARERAAVATRFPEMQNQGDSSNKQDTGNQQFWLYRALNAIASAETELSKNTDETQEAYASYRQTGKIPINYDKVLAGDKPLYALPKPVDSEFKSALPQEVDKTARVLAERVDSVPVAAFEVFMGKAPIPAGLKQLSGKVKGAPVKTLRDYQQFYFGDKFIPGLKKEINTTSDALTGKLITEMYARIQDNGGDVDAAINDFKTEPRIPFEIGGGTSQFNKARNYEAMNKLFDKFRTRRGARLGVRRRGNVRTTQQAAPVDVLAMLEWLNERVSWRELNAARAEIGMGPISTKAKAEIKDNVWVAEGQEELIPRAFIFGPKVGAYMLNRLSDFDARNADYDTMDVWESRYMRALVPQVGDEDVGIADTGTFRRLYLRLAKAFADVYQEETGKKLPISSGQASRWYEMKIATALAGYLKAGGQGTIADFSQGLQADYMNRELGGAQADLGTGTTDIVSWEPFAGTETPGRLAESIQQIEGAKTAAEGKEIAERVTPYDVDIEPEKIEAGTAKTLKGFKKRAKKDIKASEKRQREQAREPAAGVEAEGDVITAQPPAATIYQQVVGDSVDVLFQKEGEEIRGAFEKLEGGRRVVRILDGGDTGTVIHEYTHGIREIVWNAHEAGGEAMSGLTDADIRRIEGWSGVKNGKWTRKAEEKFVRGMEQRIWNGKAPNKYLQKAFDVLSNYMIKAWNKLKRSPEPMNPDVERAFDKIFVRRETVQTDALDTVKPTNNEVEATNAAEKANQEPKDFKAAERSISKDATVTPTKATVQKAEGHVARLNALESEGSNVPQEGAEGGAKRGPGVPNQYVRGEGDDAEVVLYHYTPESQEENWEVDPEKAVPKGYSRNDWERSQVKRTFFYLNVSEKEPIVNGTLYSARIKANEIYNLIKDTEGAKQQFAEEMKRGDFNGIMEHLKSKGYKGIYYNPGFSTINLFTKVNAKKTTDWINKHMEDDHASGIWQGVQKQMRAGEPAGFTYDVKTGEFVDTGIAVATSKDTEFVIDLAEVKSWEVPNLIRSYAGRMGVDLAQQNVMLGGWVDDNKLYIDVPSVLQEESVARKIGRENDQIALFNLSTGEEIRLQDEDGNWLVDEEGRWISEFGRGESEWVPDSTAPPSGDPNRKISLNQLLTDTLRRADIIMMKGDFSKSLKNARGYYAWIRSLVEDNEWGGRELAVRARDVADIGVVVHELAHALDDRYNIVGNLVGVPKRLKGRIGVDDFGNIVNQVNAADLIALAQLDYAFDQTKPMEGQTMRLTEGLAEATRLYVMYEDPSVYMGAAIDTFRGILAMNPEFKNHVEAVRKDYADYKAQDDLSKVEHLLAAGNGPIANPKESYFERLKAEAKDEGVGEWFRPGSKKWRQFWRAWEKVWFNDKYEAVMAQRQMKKWFTENFEALDEKPEGMTANEAWEQVIRRAGGDFTQMIHFVPQAANDQTHLAFINGIFNPDTNEKFGKSKSPKDIFADFDEKELEDFGLYMVSKVGIERFERDPEYRIGDTDMRAVMNSVKALEDKYDAKFKNAARDVTRYFNDLIDLQWKMGMLSAREAKAIKDSHHLYMPFFRQMNAEGSSGTGQGILGASAAVRKLGKGSHMPVLNVYDAIVDRTRQVYSEIGKWKTQNAFIQTAVQSGVGAPFIERLNDPEYHVLTPEQMLEIIRDFDIWPADLIEVYEEMLADGELDTEAIQDIESAVLRSERVKPDRVDNVIVHRNAQGMMMRYRIDPHIYGAATAGKSPMISEVVAKFLSHVNKYTSFAKFMMVAGNPFYFLPKNVFRDVQTTLIKNLQDTGTKKSGIADAAKWAAASNLNTDSDVNKMFDMMGGGRLSELRSSISTSGMITKLRDRSFRRQNLGKAKKADFTDRFTSLMNKFEGVNNFFELAPRRAAFASTLKLFEQEGGYKIDDKGNIDGKVPDWVRNRAMSNALEVTVNFNRRGELATVMEPLLLFFNAAMQGTNSQLMTAKNISDKWKAGDKIPAGRLAAWAGTMIGSKMLYLLALSMVPGDEEDETMLDQYLEVPSYLKQHNEVLMLPGGVTLMLPKEREWGMLSRLVDLAANEWSKEELRSPGAVAERIARSFGEEIMARLPITGGPLSAGAQLYFNYDLFRDQPIETTADKQNIDRLRYDDRTSWPAVGLGQLTGWAGLSPKEWDFFIRNTFGSMVPNLVDTAASAAKGDFRRAATKMPIAGSLLTETIPRESVNDVYHLNDRVRQMINAHEAGVSYPEDIVEEMYELEFTLAAAETLMRSIRNSDISKEMKQKYMTGVSRWALDRNPVAEYPNPILQYNNEDLPPEVLKTIRNLFGRLKPGKRDTEETIKAKQRIGKRIVDAQRKN